MVVNQVLSKELHVKPLKPGETALFKLLNAGKKELGRDEITTPELYWLNAQEEVLDPIANQKIVIGCIKGFTPQLENGRPKMDPSTGRPLLIPQLDRPKFVEGFLMVNSDENDKYSFLMRSNKNKDNKFRKKSSKAIFELVDKKKFVMSELQMSDYRFNAEKLIRGSEWMVLKAVKAKLNNSPDKTLHITTDDSDLEGMKLQLINVAHKNPKAIIMASDDIASKMIVTVHEAENFGIISYQSETNCWFLHNQNEYKSIHQVEANKTKIESLIDFFQSEAGGGVYQNVATVLKKLISATSK